IVTFYLSSFIHHDHNSLIIAKLVINFTPTLQGSSICSINCDLLEAKCSSVQFEKRIECLPNSSKQHCISIGCCWSEPKRFYSDVIPRCFFPDGYIGYNVTNIVYGDENIVVELQRLRPSGFPDDIEKVRVEINKLTDTLLQIKVKDAQNGRFVPSFPKLNIPKVDLKSPLYDVQVDFSGRLSVTRRSTKAIVFSTALTRLIFSNQFHQLSSQLPSKYVYGLGEHKEEFRKEANWKLLTLWNRDQAPTFNASLYGSHPFYFTVEENSSKSNGVFLFNSNAMDVILSPAPAITYRPIGGVLNFFVFVEETPAAVVADYIKLIGLPPMPPVWALGFHLCRWGYNTLNNTIEVWNRTRNAFIPFDVQWNDIDYMQNYNDFTVDPKRFNGLGEFVDHIHELGMRYVLILDPGVSGGEDPNTYPPYDDGIKMNLFVKDADDEVLIGRVWNKKGKTVFPDFTNPKAYAYWLLELKRLYSLVKFDGIWIDMNEVSNFEDGSLYGCPISPLEEPPYLPGGIPLYTKTLCMTAKTFAGKYYDVKNLFSTYETYVTNRALRSLRAGKRPFIISRSTFSGQGHYGSHWTGDISSTWEDMRYSIPAILDFNIFGIPFVGADICGFNGNTSVELCARWMSLGAFYPFSRNHNSWDTIAQDPVALGPIVVAAARNALGLRYMLLPHLYTLFYRAHNFGETVARALFFNFPHDKASYEIESEFMLGSALIIVPVLQIGARYVDAYLPPARWYNPNSYLEYHSKGEYFNLTAPLEKINVLLRGGSIIVIADPTLRVSEMRKADFSLTVALDEKNEAKGELYWDDGESIDAQRNGEFNLIEFKAENNSVSVTPKVIGYQAEKSLSGINVAGLLKKPSKVLLNAKPVNYSYFEETNYLRIDFKTPINLFTKFSLSWNI
ncbi:lysosomal alpha-glucosidase-like protein, partial [Dinothrombium tinctorium]